MTVLVSQQCPSVLSKEHMSITKFIQWYVVDDMTNSEPRKKCIFFSHNLVPYLLASESDDAYRLKYANLSRCPYNLF